MNTLHEQNTALPIVKAGGTYNCHWAFKGCVHKFLFLIYIWLALENVQLMKKC
jgi:hypothetical protein